jgi:casein kinase II subunit alpha
MMFGRWGMGVNCGLLSAYKKKRKRCGKLESSSERGTSCEAEEGDMNDVTLLEPRRRRRRPRVPLNKGGFCICLILQLASISCVSSEKAYPLGCSQRSPSYYDYENAAFPPASLPVTSVDDYLLTRRLGTGKFSDVFEAVNVDLERRIPGNKHPAVVDPRTLVVIKCLKPVSERKIRREILVLERANALPNLARLLAVVVSPEYYASNRRRSTDLPRMPALVLQHAGPNAQWLCHGHHTAPTTSFSVGATQTTLQQQQPNKSDNSVSASSMQQQQQQQQDDNSSSYSTLTDYEIRYYLYHLLIALDGLHEAGLMHRDVKPRNVLINRTGRANAPLMLIDLGLADFYNHSEKYNVRVASRHYKAPELLLGYGYYDYAIDLWGVGCILAGLLWRREPFFRGRDNTDQLDKIVGLLGMDGLWAFVNKYQVVLSEELQRVLQSNNDDEDEESSSQTRQQPRRRSQRMSWSTYREEEQQRAKAPPEMPSRDALDLLDHLLVYDHEERWTAQQAMRHVYFDSVRERVEAEVRSYRPAISTTSSSL